MVTPQQRKQVIVKSIGDIGREASERESTVHARPMGSRMGQVAAAAAFGNNIGEGIGGIKESFSSVKNVMVGGAGTYGKFAGSKINWLLIGLTYGNTTTRRYAVPQKNYSMVANIPNYLITAHVLGSSVLYGLSVLRRNK